MVSELAYLLIFPDGREARLFSDGKVEGLPYGTVVMNRVSYLLRVARSQPDRSSLAQNSSELGVTLKAGQPEAPLPV
jgi:hypothetical protein